MPGRLSRTTTAHIATVPIRRSCSFFFFFQAEDGIRDYKVTGVQTCALPISRPSPGERLLEAQLPAAGVLGLQIGVADRETGRVVLKETWLAEADRKSTRLNSSHLVISYAVFCLKKKKKHE